MYHVLSSQSNMNGKCANTCCAFKFRNIFPKAIFYHTTEKSWVCTTCAQGINREKLGNAMRYGAKYSQVCINSEDALALILKTGYATPQVA